MNQGKVRMLGERIKASLQEVRRLDKAYLQTLDALEQLERAPIDAEKPYRVLAEHI